MMIATDAQPKFSSPAAMPCKTWSLQAIDTCPGSRAPGGGLVDACADCYATTNFYTMPATIAVRAHNLDDWKHADWTAAMIHKIKRGKRFRWFDSGDVYQVALAEKMYQVMQATPNTQHWLPTRSHKFEKFAKVFARMQALPNVVVRKSSDSVTGGRIRGKNTSTIIQTAAQARDAHICPKTVHGAVPKCAANNCYACWDKTVPTIAYFQH